MSQTSPDRPDLASESRQDVVRNCGSETATAKPLSFTPGPRRPSEEEQARKKALLRLLEADRARLLLWHPFTARLALHLAIVPLCDWRVPTAATDGRHVFFDIDFADTLTPAERVGVLAHELWHSAMAHSLRQGPRDRKLWGLAADAEVNALLSADGLQVPEHAVRFSEMAGRSAEQIYAWLRDQCPQEWLGLATYDVHDPLPGATPQHVDWVEDPDFACGAAMSEEMRRQWQHNLAVAMQSAARAGALPAGVAQLVQKVLEPRVSWNQVLSQFLQRSRAGASSWARISRRHIWRSAWLPGRADQSLRIVVGLDTSGSTEGLLASFVAELRGILKSFREYDILVLECDARIHRETRITPANASGWMREVVGAGGLLGGGGTSFLEIFERADKEDPHALLLFTDGDGLAPEHPPRWPVLWVLAGEGARRPVDWGQSVVIPGDVAAQA